MTRRSPGSRRSPHLHMVIRETPVPEKDPTPAFPKKFMGASLRTSEENILDDIASRIGIPEDDITVTIESTFMRGLGQTDTYTIKANVRGYSPAEINRYVDDLVDAGYKFSIVEFR